MYVDTLFIIGYENACSSGVNQWRDQLKPSQILENLTRLRGLPPPQIAEDGSSLSFGGRDYNLQDIGIPGVIAIVCCACTIERSVVQKWSLCGTENNCFCVALHC